MRFSIRFLAILMAIIAICCVYAQDLIELVLDCYYPISVVLLFGTFLAGQRLLMQWKVSQRFHVLSSINFAVGLLVLAAAMLVVWARYRWVMLYFTGEFPYPDTLLLQFCNWLDARNPAPPGFLKLHGEYDTVLLILTLATYTLSLVAGLLLGLSIRTNGFFGLAYWKSRVVGIIRG
jgi:hypothetical protein